MGRGWIAQVEEGMDVYDREGDKVGTVKEVFLGTSSEEAEEYVSDTDNEDGPSLYPDGSLLDNLAEAFADEELPEAVRARLLQHGYLRVDGGLLQDDYFVIADHIVGVTDEGVRLNERKGELLHR